MHTRVLAWCMRLIMFPLATMFICHQSDKVMSTLDAALFAKRLSSGFCHEYHPWGSRGSCACDMHPVWRWDSVQGSSAIMPKCLLYGVAWFQLHGNLRHHPLPMH